MLVAVAWHKLQSLPSYPDVTAHVYCAHFFKTSSVLRTSRHDEPSVGVGLWENACPASQQPGIGIRCC